MPRISGLGHVGLYCNDLGRMRDFYAGVLRLTISDEHLKRATCFLSAAPGAQRRVGSGGLRAVLSAASSAEKGGVVYRPISERATGRVTVGANGPPPPGGLRGRFLGLFHRQRPASAPAAPGDDGSRVWSRS